MRFSINSNKTHLRWWVLGPVSHQLTRFEASGLNLGRQQKAFISIRWSGTYITIDTSKFVQTGFQSCKTCLVMSVMYVMFASSRSSTSLFSRGNTEMNYFFLISTLIYVRFKRLMVWSHHLKSSFLGSEWQKKCTLCSGWIKKCNALWFLQHRALIYQQNWKSGYMKI